MIVSLGELQTAVERASRFYGVPLGIARHTASVAASLAKRKVNPLALVLDGLTSPEIGTAGPAWIEAGDSLIADVAAGSAGSAILRAPLACNWLLSWPTEARSADLKRVDSPAWVEACAAHAARKAAVTLTVSIDGGRVTIRSTPGSSQRSADVVPFRGGVTVPDADWVRINELAARTFVPASEVSRRMGAGFEAASVRARLDPDRNRWVEFDD